ncbi:hypothetical protein HKD37_19G053417 [Glycine soja]
MEQGWFLDSQLRNCRRTSGTSLIATLQLLNFQPLHRLTFWFIVCLLRLGRTWLIGQCRNVNFDSVSHYIFGLLLTELLNSIIKVYLMFVYFFSFVWFLTPYNFGH